MPKTLYKSTHTDSNMHLRKAHVHPHSSVLDSLMQER